MKLSDIETFDEDEMHKMYDDVLNELYPIVKIGYGRYYPSDIVRELSPTDYRCGFVDWADMDYTEHPNDSDLYVRKDDLENVDEDDEEIDDEGEED